MLKYSSFNNIVHVTLSLIRKRSIGKETQRGHGISK